MKIVNTNNYDKFKFVKWNREIDWNHVERLKHSIKVHGQLEEIQCTSDYKILDGQHRFHALKALNLPVQAILKKTAKEEDLHEMNDVRKGWTTLDSLNEYCEKGINDYFRLRQKIKLHEDVFPIGAIITSYNHSTYFKKNNFKNGKYQFNEIKGNAILNYCHKMANVIENKAYQTKFVEAIGMIIAKNRNFDIERLYRAAQNKKMYVYSSRQDTYNGIVELYNFKLKIKENMIS
jgi:hypothetical protein